MDKLYRLLWSFTLSPVLLFAGIAHAADDITGAGATFPTLAYVKWGEAYKEKTGAGLSYQSIGSGGGVKQITAKIVDFGASDVPMGTEELSAKGLAQFPTLIGGVVPVVNLPGVAPGQLKLSGDVLADIFLGKITQWNDSRIAADNKDMRLPDQKIFVIYRADQSGTAFVFTSYLAEVSPEWKHNVGVGTSVRWPVGAGGKGNEGAALFVDRLQGSIGFVEYSTAMKNKMAYVQLKNREGQFVSPSESGLKAAAHAAWDGAKAFGEMLVNQEGKESWPITSATFVLVYKTQPTAARGQGVLKFFDWAYSDGAKPASELGYVPLPKEVVKMVHSSWKEQMKDATGHALWQ